MKRLILFFLLAFIVGCKSSDNRDINADESNYLELKNSQQGNISLIGDKTNSMEDLQSALNKKAQEGRLVLPDDKDYTFYKLFVDSKGNVNKVLPEEKESIAAYDSMNAETISKWKFDAVEINGEPLDVSFDFVFIGPAHSKELYTLLLKGAEEAEYEKTYFPKVSQQPEIIGGINALRDLIVYPRIAKESGVQGSVFTRAYVDETGSVEKVKIIHGLGFGCDVAALEAIKQIKFIPGKQDGKAVKVQVIIPIKYKLG